MPCCKAKDYKWCKDLSVVDYKDVEDNEYCVFHAPKGEKGITLQDFNKLIFERINEAKAKSRGCNLSGTVFEGDIYFSQFNKDYPLPNINFSYTKFCKVADFGLAHFSGDVDFRRATFNGKSDFIGTTFDNEADFLEAKFDGKTDFIGAKFSKKANFLEITFIGEVDLKRAKFSEEADFTGAKFNEMADFSRAIFSKKANFFRSTFSGEANFAETSFIEEVYFFKTTFGKEVSFIGTRFSKILKANFQEATFSGKSYFIAIFDGGANFFESKFGEDAYFSRTKFKEEVNFSGANFNKMVDFHGVLFDEKTEADFRRVKFKGEADFRETIFGGKTYFRETNFNKKADFRTTKFSEETEADFWGSSFYGEADFRLAIFRGTVNFFGASFNKKTYLFGDTFIKRTDFGNINIEEEIRFEKVNLKKISFIDTDLRKIDYINCTWPEKGGYNVLYDELQLYEEEKSFKEMNRDITAGWLGIIKEKYEALKIYSIPEHKQRIKKVEILYRQLKQKCKEDHNEYEVSNWHYGEKEMFRRSNHWRRILPSISTLYWLSSGYGERPVRAGIALFILLLAISVLFGLAGLDPNPTLSGNPSYEIAEIKGLTDIIQNFTGLIANTLQYATFEQEPGFIPKNIYGTFLKIVAKVFIPLQAALFALAVRNRFRR